MRIFDWSSDVCSSDRRSRRLIIAGNKAHDTKEKHGIIVSREVDDSWIINNQAYDNALSGIVIDRNSVNNVVAHNRVYRNHADGITIYESPKTLIWQNLVSANLRSEEHTYELQSLMR